MSIKLLMRVKNFVSVSEVRKQLEGVLPFISFQNLQNDTLANLPHGYINRVNGNAVHGKVATFTPTELTTLANALKDVAGKLTHAASAFV